MTTYLKFLAWFRKLSFNLNEKRISPMENLIAPKELNQTLANYLIVTASITDLVMEAAAQQDPERYAHVCSLVKTGRLTTRTESTANSITISLIDANTGANIGDIFTFGAGALLADAGGVAN